MSGRKFDMAIVGGGLAGGLIALAVHRARPELELTLLEAGPSLGGNRRWTWFASDRPPAGAALLDPFRKTSWTEGYEVRFPAWRRQIGTACHTLASDEFHEGLRRMLPAGLARTGAGVVALDATGVTLADGERIAARTVIDCRGFAHCNRLSGGWQTYLGRQLRTAAPHRLQWPVLVDARIDQRDGCRFVEVLPLGARELFVKLAHYGESPDPDRRALGNGVEAYCTEHGWQGDILGSESGALPIIAGGDFSAFQAMRRIAGVAVAGAGAGLLHPLTAAGLPQAVETALAIAAEADLPGQQLAALLEDQARRHWRASRLGRSLGRIMFGAALPQQRHRLLEHLYSMPRETIERLHATRPTSTDRTRILCARQPLPPRRTIAALLRRGPAMAEGRPA